MRTEGSFFSVAMTTPFVATERGGEEGREGRKNVELSGACAGRKRDAVSKQAQR